MKLQIDYSKCCWQGGRCTSCSCGGACNGCVEICPAGALSRKEQLEINHDACLLCGLCIDACKHGALSLI